MLKVVYNKPMTTKISTYIIVGIALIALCAVGYLGTRPQKDQELPLDQTPVIANPLVMSVTIMIPNDMEKYIAAMNDYVSGGKPNPSKNWSFVKKTVVVVVSSTTDTIKASAQAAAEQIPTQSGKIGSVVDYFKIIDGTAYILLHMHLDGWAGVSISLAKIEPLVEKTLLQFPEITSVKFETAPGDKKSEIMFQ